MHTKSQYKIVILLKLFKFKLKKQSTQFTTPLPQFCAIYRHKSLSKMKDLFYVVLIKALPL